MSFARSTTSLALLGAAALTTPLWHGAAHAQAATGSASAAEARRYDIPPGALGGVLARFSAESGVLLAGAAELVQGRQSPGLQGSHTARSAIDALLAGTGLEAVRQADGSYSLRPAASAPDAAAQNNPSGDSVLPAVKVSARSESATTEGSASYTSASLSTATKLPLSIRETPQSVSVVTRARIEDQAMVKVGDAIAATPGLAITSFSGPNREVYYARGFLVRNYTFDGLPVSFTDVGGQSLLNDLAMFDRVEVVRGSTGMTQGAGTPSAAINFVRKRPTADFQASVQGQLGSWNHRGLQLDVSGPLNAAGSVRGRAVAHGWDSDSFQDVAGEGRKLLYLIGEVDLGRRTLLTLSLAHQRNDSNTTYSGLPTAPDGSDLKLPRSTYLGNQWNYWDDTNTSVFATLEHRFDNGWKANFSTLHIQGEQNKFVSGVYLNGAAYDLTGLKAFNGNDRTSYDLHAAGPFEAFGRQHELVFGAGARVARERADVAGYWPAIYLASDIDVFDWTHDAPKPAATTEDLHGRSEERQRGVYTTARLNLRDDLKLIAGLRLDWFRFANTDDIYDWDAAAWTRYQGAYRFDRHVTKYAGLVYDLDARHSAYASYTDIFQPQDARDASNDFIKPIVGKNYEVGVKGEYFGGALNASAALFRVDQANLAMATGPCPFNPTITCYKPAGVVRSDGFELEAQGALAPNWQIGGGYAYVSTKVHRDSDPAVVGTRQNTKLPTRQLKASTSYAPAGSAWRFGANLRWQNRVYHFDDWMGHDYRTEQAAYAVVDAMVGYRFDKHLDLQLNVGNLFDKTYYREINTQPMEWGGNALYGEPRRLMLTARYKF